MNIHLDEITLKLIEAAKKASRNSYSTYSNYPVGAAILADNKIYSGCNVENASYGLSICAERNAIFKAISESGHLNIEKIVIYTPTSTPAVSCGACKQVIAEFSSDCQIISVCNSKDIIVSNIKEFIPIAFKLNN